MSANPRFLVTGAYGCIGAWVVHELLSDKIPVVTFDLSTEPRRLRLLLDNDELAAVPHVVGDITDLAALEHALDEHGISNIIHLAALQVPFCRADPILGAHVNVVGTINVFEAAKRRRDALHQIVYASSVAAYDPQGTLIGPPGTLYGVYKRANEATASVYFADDGVSSIGLRPHTVYGVGRDQGVTSAPTIAMLAAAAGVPYRIPYSGAAQLQFARDVARAFIAASLVDYKGASVHGIPGSVVAVSDLVAAIGVAAPDGEIAYDDAVLPFPSEVDSRTFAQLVPDFIDTPLELGVSETVKRFRLLLEQGLVEPPTVATA